MLDACPWPSDCRAGNPPNMAPCSFAPRLLLDLTMQQRPRLVNGTAHESTWVCEVSEGWGLPSSRACRLQYDSLQRLHTYLLSTVHPLTDSLDSDSLGRSELTLLRPPPPSPPSSCCPRRRLDLGATTPLFSCLPCIVSPTCMYVLAPHAHPGSFARLAWRPL